ncbi:MAG: hypothetical protein AAFR61_04810 [Bacteroidota bacterium]
MKSLCTRLGLGMLLCTLLSTTLFSQSKVKDRLSVDFGLSLWNHTHGEYLNYPQPVEVSLQIPSPEFHLKVGYDLKPGLQLGFQYHAHVFQRQLFYGDPELEGTFLDDAAATHVPYQRTEQWDYIRDKFLGVYLGAPLLREKFLEIDARLSLEGMLFRGTGFSTHLYGDQRSPGESFFYRTYLPGVGLGLDVRVPMNDQISLRVSGQGIYGFGKVRPESPRNYRYTSLNAGISARLQGKPRKPQKSSRKNTLMVGIGWPVSLSYERLLYDGKLKQSARVFVDQYYGWGPYPGLAYNLKWGRNGHYILGEVFVSELFNLQPGANIGYEYRGKRGFVFRADLGSVLNDLWALNLREAAFPRGQIHFGYAF